MKRLFGPQEIPMAECGVLTDAAIENSTLLEFSLAANEATPEMLYRRRDPKVPDFLSDDR